MKWICTSSIYTKYRKLLFKEGKVYTEQDYRGEAIDIAICLLSETNVKTYLINGLVRNNFKEYITTL